MTQAASPAAVPDDAPWPSRRALAGALAALLVLLTTPASAADPPNPMQGSLAANPDSAMRVALAEIEGTPLTLAAAIESALRHSTSVREAEAALRAARGAARRERGVFDPELFAGANWREEDQPSASFFSGASVLRIRETTAATGARVTLPFGTRLSASLDAVRFESNSAFSALSPQYDATGTLSIRQPLLKGFGPGAWGERSAANREWEAARSRYDDAVLEARARVEQAYWDLYAAERDVAAARLIRDQARALLSQAELRNRAGLVGPNQVANARVFLAEQEQAVMDREEALDRISDGVASRIGARPQGGALRYRPIDDPPMDFAVPDQDSLVARALARNNEVKALEREAAAARARHVGARWNAYPQLDLVGTLGGKGLSGRPRDVIFGGDTLRTSISGDFGDAYAQARDREFPTWSAGVQVTIPIGFRQGAGERDRLRGEADQAVERTIAERRSLEERVRAGHRDLVYAARRLEAARDGVEASLEQVRIGVVEYNNGRTTAFELVRLGADLASAQQRYSQALVRTAKSVAELRLLTSGDYPTPNGGSSSP